MAEAGNPRSLESGPSKAIARKQPTDEAHLVGNRADRAICRARAMSVSYGLLISECWRPTPLMSGALGLLLAVFLCGLGLTISSVTASNRTALSVSLLLLLAIFFPTQIPLSAQQSGFGDFLLRADPMTAGLRYLSQLLIRGHSATAELGWLVGPAVAAAVTTAAAIAIGSRLSLRAIGRP